MKSELALIQRLRNLRALCNEAVVVCDGPQLTVFVLDVSSSMDCDDYPPSRYLAGVAAVRQYITAQAGSGRGDVFGAVVFNTQARVLCNGADMARIEQSVFRPFGRIEPDGGTDIEAGVTAGGKILLAADPKYVRRMLVLTDGQGGDPSAEGRRLKSAGVTIDCVGIGGSRKCVNKPCLMDLASVVNGKTRYRFIADKDDLAEHFRMIATDLAITR